MSVIEPDFSSDLPIFDQRTAILSAVDANQVTIVTAETGAGKSTQVPQYLAEHGYQKVIVTQPRILAARNLSRRVREEWAIRTGKDSDEVIGYRTAHERDDNPGTQILYCTDGLQLVREITGAGISERQVLILDEVHEWNENMEVLVAWAKKRCQEEPRFKVVIMSATIETDTLATYFDTSAVIAVPGRSHEVTKRRGTDVVSEIIDQLTTAKSNMLVFLPGKAEIQDITDAIKTKADAAGVPIIPLHSQLEATAQQQAFANYPNGKVILATNIAQTSVTIDDIDVVIDSGLERRSEVRNGVEGLFIAQVSQADCLQRAGRAGRTKAGEYILAPHDTLPCLEFDDRPEYATPEILRKHIDRLTLRLANVGIDIELLDFYHDPSHKAVAQAKRTLIALGALTKNGEVTRIGRQMEQFPVESSYARMLIEAQEYGKDVQTKLAAIIGIQEVGGIVKGGTRHTGWHKYTKQTKSDLLAQYDVFLELPNILHEEYEDLGIIGKNVSKAREVMERLDRDLKLDDNSLTAVTDDEQDKLLRCIVAGQIDQLWTVGDHGEVVHIATKKVRELSSSTVVRSPKLIVGTPFDLQVPTHSGSLETLHLVQGVTAVNTKWLLELAPHLFAARQGKNYYDPRSGRLATRQLVRFGGRVLEGGGASVTDNTPQNRRLFNETFATWAYEQLERERRNLGRYHNKRIPSIPLRQLQQQVKTIAGGVISLDELNQKQRADLTNLARLQTHVGDDFMARLGTTAHRHDQHEKRHRSWKPAHKRKYDRRKGR
ncbi:MAG TPA: helicase-related protein [Candidatus Saccharimonadales bacterium]|nr:helicase-related protein [Candidatus Saccharimonadales bacterium]